MEYRPNHHLDPHELTDATIIIHWGGDQGWVVAGFVLGATTENIGEQTRFAVGEDATIRNEPVIGKRVQGADIRLARYRQPDPTPPPPEISLEDLPPAEPGP